MEVVGFLNYCLANRTARAQAELSAPNYSTEVGHFKKIAGDSANALLVYDQIINRVREEGPKPDALEE